MSEKYCEDWDINKGEEHCQIEGLFSLWINVVPVSLIEDDLTHVCNRKGDVWDDEAPVDEVDATLLLQEATLAPGLSLSL